jgi:hypothetical protein
LAVTSSPCTPPLPDAVWINPPTIPTAPVTPDTPPYPAIPSQPSGAQAGSRVSPQLDRLAQPLTPTSTGPQLAIAGEGATTQSVLQ